MIKVRVGNRFIISENLIGKITEVFALGFNYHTLDGVGNCVKGQTHMLKSDFEKANG